MISNVPDGLTPFTEARTLKVEPLGVMVMTAPVLVAVNSAISFVMSVARPAATALALFPDVLTGAPSIGKIVMEAAAKHLGSVTLELGGKSPTIVDETAQVDAAAHRVAWAKFTNNGQICLAPDYVFVHESKKDEFLEKVRETLTKFYGEDAQQSGSYARIVNERHYKRVAGLVDGLLPRQHAGHVHVMGIRRPAGDQQQTSYPPKQGSLPRGD